MKLLTSRRAQQILLAILIIIITALTGVDAADIEPPNSWLEPAQPGYYQVARVDDGDTITVATSAGTETVRLIGVDTPELHHPDKPVQCWAQEASRATRQLINHQPVRLVADPADDNRDLYGRLLRYVYLPDGTLVNAELIAAGHGFAYTLFPFEKRQQFTALEEAASRRGAGLWQHCQVTTADQARETQAIEAASQ